MRKQKGFTLIELLVVIAIIGLLSTLAVVSLNNARAKARDAKRVSDLKQISTLIEMEAANTEEGAYDAVITGCAAGDLVSACTIGLTGSTANFHDPSATVGTACVGVAAVPPAGPTMVEQCDYTVALLDDAGYEICGNLEDGAGGIDAGPVGVGTGSHMSACTNIADITP